MLDRCKYPYLVYRIFLFLVGKVLESHHLESVGLAIHYSHHLVNLAVGPIPEGIQHLKLVQRRTFRLRSLLGFLRF
jgi:hypothetical protein